MKKFLLSTFALLAMVSTVFGADKLIVENAYLSITNSTTDFPVFFSFDEKSSISGVNFSIQLPDGVEFVLDGEDPAYALGTTFDGTPTMNIVSGILKVAMGSSNPIKGANGMLITFRIKPTDASAFTDGQTLTGGRIFDATGSKNGVVNFPETTFSIKATNRIVLDENSSFAPPTSGTGKNVLVKRTLKADTWSTICLPFVMTRDQLEDAFGADVEVAEFSASSYDEANGIAIEFETTDGQMTNGKPYLIKTSSAYSNFTVDNIRFRNANNPVEQDLDNIENGLGSMMGTYVIKAMEKNELFLQDNTFYYAVAGQTIKGFRATFNFTDGDGKQVLIPNTSSARAILSINGSAIEDGTGINSMILTAKTGKVYSVSGQYMGENVDLKSLPKGVYIVDGNKVVNK